MPYRSNNDLPSSVRLTLPKSAQNVWRSAFNRAYEKHGEDSTAFRIAWGAVRNAGYQEDEETGMWDKVARARTFRPPQAARNNSRRGLDLCKQHSYGEDVFVEAGTNGNGTSIARANMLASGCGVPVDIVDRMKAYFDRERIQYRPNKRTSDGGPTAGTVSWLLWGGTAGKHWAERVLRQEDKRMEKEGSSGEGHLRYAGEVIKVDDSLGLVFGYAIVCKEKGEPYYDLQGDYIPEDVMLEAAVDFMESSRPIGEMHKTTTDGGLVVFMFPMTAEVAKAYKIETPRTGLLVAVKPNDPAILEKFKSGEYTGFSIEGSCVREVEANE